MNRNIRFKSPGHRNRFLDTLVKLGVVYDGSPDIEFASALYILTADVSTFKKASEYITQDGIAIARMIKEVDFSGGYYVLIKLAGNLFNGEQHLDPLELMKLDEANLQVAFTAILLRRFNVTMEDFIGETDGQVDRQ